MNSASTTSQQRFHLSGYVKWFDAQRKYGFIVDDESDNEVLLPLAVLLNYGQSSIANGSRIAVLAERTPSGIQAREVLRVAPAEDDEPSASGDKATTPFIPAVVVFFDTNKGFGFVNTFKSSESHFLHVRVLQKAGLQSVEGGEALAVRIRTDDKGSSVTEVGQWC